MNFIRQDQKAPAGEPPEKAAHALRPFGEHLLHLRGNARVLAAAGIARQFLPVIKMRQRYYRVLFHIFPVDRLIIGVVHQAEDMPLLRL